MAWEVISTYSRSDALADGLLTDVTEEAAKAGFKIPVALTSAAWADCVEWSGDDNARKVYQDQSGRLWDVLWMASLAARRSCDGDRLTFQVYRVPRNGATSTPRPVALVMHIGPGDTFDPVITIGFTQDF